MIKEITIPEGFEIPKVEYVDLGLLSGTKWAKTSEEGYYTYEEAIKKFPNLPKRWQFTELIDECKWVWEDNKYKIIGPNGNYIYMYAAGWCSFDCGVNCVGTDGNYWSSTPKNSKLAWDMCFDSSTVIIDFSLCRANQSIHLCK